MVLGVISHQTRSQLAIIDGTLNSNGYRDIFHDYVRPLAGALNPEHFLYESYRNTWTGRQSKNAMAC